MRKSKVKNFNFCCIIFSGKRRNDKYIKRQIEHFVVLSLIYIVSNHL